MSKNKNNNLADKFFYSLPIRYSIGQLEWIIQTQTELLTKDHENKDLQKQKIVNEEIVKNIKLIKSISYHFFRAKKDRKPMLDRINSSLKFLQDHNILCMPNKIYDTSLWFIYDWHRMLIDHNNTQEEQDKYRKHVPAWEYFEQEIVPLLSPCSLLNQGVTQFSLHGTLWFSATGKIIFSTKSDDDYSVIYGEILKTEDIKKTMEYFVKKAKYDNNVFCIKQILYVLPDGDRYLVNTMALKKDSMLNKMTEQDKIVFSPTSDEDKILSYTPKNKLFPERELVNNKHISILSYISDNQFSLTSKSKGQLEELLNEQIE
jgi:hypothetical protein